LVDFELTEDSDSEADDDDDGYAKNDRLKPSDVGGTEERTQTKRWPKHGSEKFFVPFTIHGPSFSRRHIEIIKDAMRKDFPYTSKNPKM
jgi:hypothetical protein